MIIPSIFIAVVANLYLLFSSSFFLDNAKFPYELAPAGECSPFQDISSTGTKIEPPLEDDDYKEIPLGDNIFTFYTTPVQENKVFLSSNGYLSFLPNPDYTDSIAKPIPDSSKYPDNFIAPFWTDLDPEEGGNIYYRITSTEFIAQWSGIPPYFNSTDAPPDDTNTFQASLSFETGAIEFRYAELTDPRLDRLTIGVENVNGDRGLSIPTQDILAGTTTCVKIVNLAVNS